jgi:hypothetical protein
MKNLTEKQIQKYAYEFLQCEGCINGKECDTLEEYIREATKVYIYNDCLHAQQGH